MNSIKNLERLQRIHQLIKQEVTGDPKCLAKRINVSERLIYCLIDELKDYDANIEYDRKRKTYYYSNDFVFKIDISIVILNAGICTKSYKL